MRSAKVAFILFDWTLVASFILPFLIPDFNWLTYLVIGISFWFVTAIIPCIPFHLNYFLANRSTRIIINNTTQAVYFNSQDLAYSLSDIIVTRHLLGHHSPGRTKSWIPIPFDNYGYLRIETPDGKVFFVSSLLIDPFRPPFHVDKDEYGFPFI